MFIPFFFGSCSCLTNTHLTSLYLVSNTVPGTQQLLCKWQMLLLPLCAGFKESQSKVCFYKTQPLHPAQSLYAKSLSDFVPDFMSYKT